MSKEVEIRRQIRALNNELEHAMIDEVAGIKAKLLVLWQSLMNLRRETATIA